MSTKIIGFKNGPLKLEFDKTVLYKDGIKLESENPSYMCRCGHSKSKPFCDGTHEEIGFKTKCKTSKEIMQTYKGTDITIDFNRSICAGSGNCVRGLDSVFKSDKSNSWIFPDEEINSNIIETINSCPSGALSFSIDGKTTIDKRSEPKISVAKNGPYMVEGIVHEGMPTPTNFCPTKYTLCRCGNSENKPYCDYSHAKHEWNDEI